MINKQIERQRWIDEHTYLLDYLIEMYGYQPISNFNIFVNNISELMNTQLGENDIYYRGIIILLHHNNDLNTIYINYTQPGRTKALCNIDISKIMEEYKQKKEFNSALQDLLASESSEEAIVTERNEVT